jgi:hypothetical protein
VKAIGTVLLAGGVLAIALAAGYLVALGLTMSIGAVFVVAAEDESTIRVLVLTGLTYLAWAIVTAFVFRRLWRWLRSP